LRGGFPSAAIRWSSVSTSATPSTLAAPLVAVQLADQDGDVCRAFSFFFCPPPFLLDVH